MRSGMGHRRYSYEDAAAAMQAGVALEISLDGGGDPGRGNATPKHLRVGVNSALVDSASLARLLIAKGVIAEAEYLDALAEGMNREVEQYEARLTARTGRRVALSPGVARIDGHGEVKVS